MDIHLSSLPILDNVCALCGEIQCGHSQDKAKSFECLCRPNPGRFQLKAVGFIVEEVLFNIKT